MIYEYSCYGLVASAETFTNCLDVRDDILLFPSAVRSLLLAIATL